MQYLHVETVFIPYGSYRTSDTITLLNKYRSKAYCEGVIKPFGAFDDFLFKVTNSSGDPIMPSMATNISINGLTLDCEWQSRGFFGEKMYDSDVNSLRVWRPYGAGISTPMQQEVSWYNPVIFAGRPRSNTLVSGATAWSAATTYTNEVVYIEYPAYNVGTTYAGNDIVSDSGILYRSTEDSNLGNALTTTSWERIPYEYFVATGLAGNLNKSPHDATTAYTTRHSTSANHFWKPIYADEAA